MPTRRDGVDDHTAMTTPRQQSGRLEKGTCTGQTHILSVNRELRQRMKLHTYPSCACAQGLKINIDLCSTRMHAFKLCKDIWRTTIVYTTPKLLLF